MSLTTLIQRYYLASPLLFVVGWWWGLEVRATFLPSPEARFLYYLFLSALGLLAHLRPSSTPYVALGESSLNLFLLMAWILVPLWSLAEKVEGGSLALPYSASEVLLNGLLAGGFFLLGFYQAQDDLLRAGMFPGSRKRNGPKDRM